MKRTTSGLLIGSAIGVLLLSIAVVDPTGQVQGCGDTPAPGSKKDAGDPEGPYKSGRELLPGRQSDAAYLGTHRIVAYQEWVDYIDGRGREAQYPRILVTAFDEHGQRGDVLHVSDFKSGSEEDRRLARLRPPELDAPDDLTPGGRLLHVSHPSVAVDPRTGTILVAFQYLHEDPHSPKHRFSLIVGRFLQLRDGELSVTDELSEPIVLSSLRTGIYDERLDRTMPWASVDAKRAYLPKALALDTATRTFALAYVLEHPGVKLNLHSTTNFWDSRVVVKIVTPRVETAFSDPEAASANTYVHRPGPRQGREPTGITALDAAVRDTDLGKTPLPGIGWVHAVYHTDLNARRHPHERLDGEGLEALGERNLKLFSVKVDAQQLVRDTSLDVAYAALPGRWPLFRAPMGVSILLEDVLAEPRLLPVDEHLIVSYNDGDERIVSDAIRMYTLRRNDGIGYQRNRADTSLFAPRARLHDTLSLGDGRVALLYSAAVAHELPHPALVEHTSVLGSSVFEYLPEQRGMKPVAWFWIDPDLTSSEGIGRGLVHPEEGMTVVWPRHDRDFLEGMGGAEGEWNVHTEQIVVPKAAESLLGLKLDLRHRVSPRAPHEVVLRIGTDPSDRRFDPTLGPFHYDVQVVTDDARTHALRRALGVAPPELFWQNQDAAPHAASARAVLEFQNGIAFLSNGVRFEVDGR